MEYHQSIAAPSEPILTALTRILNTYGYRLERSFDLRVARPAPAADQYLVLLAYEQAASTPPIVITAHERDGVTHLSASTIQPGAALTRSLLAALHEVPADLA
jgi:hypothetical protein